MSDHPREAQRNLRKIFICDDIWLDDIFYFFDHAEVGLELALLSDRFDGLVDTHFRTRKWALGKLSIDRSETGIYAEITNYGNRGKLPIPAEPFPRNIIGFHYLRIEYFDIKVIAFLRRIRRLFESDFTLAFDHWSLQKKDWVTFVTKIWPLLNVSGITEMRFEQFQRLNSLRVSISPTVLRDCSNLRTIFFGNDFDRDGLNLLSFPPNDTDRASVCQALCKWLHTPLSDGRPKKLGTCIFGNRVWVDQLIETFLNANTSVSFIIFALLREGCSFETFKLDNLRTREQLTFERNGIFFGKEMWLIKRGPIATNVQQCAEWKHRNELVFALCPPSLAQMKAARRFKRLRQKGAGSSREGK